MYNNQDKIFTIVNKDKNYYLHLHLPRYLLENNNNEILVRIKEKSADKSSVIEVEIVNS